MGADMVSQRGRASDNRSRKKGLASPTKAEALDFLTLQRDVDRAINGIRALVDKHYQDPKVLKVAKTSLELSLLTIQIGSTL
jgi:hypothetical protein